MKPTKASADLKLVPDFDTGPAYRITEEINASANAKIYRAVRSDGGQAVILKVHPEGPAGREIFKRSKKEAEIIQTIRSARVIRCFGFEQFANSAMLVLEDIGGQSLKDLIKDGPLELDRTLLYGSQVAEGLNEIHSVDIIHKDISPDNIVINESSHELRIIDFGHATMLSREHQSLVNPGILAGTLAYMSPEQTGRMNRTIDYRSDYYAFGATLYHMLVGRPPFAADDPLDLVHMHIARHATPPCEVDPRIPRMVSDIVMKLLSKTAEDRYQSGWGIKADLDECLRQWNLNGVIEQFVLARHDKPHQFQLPQKLYGRETEIDILLSKFDNVAQGGREIVYIGGYSGIGKTSLVREVYKLITASRGYFISGKFSQFQRTTPFKALLDALRDLVKQLLTENEEQLDYWRARLQEAVGSNGQLITNALPDLEIIIGPQPAIPLLEPAETQNRINLVFRNFISVFCQSRHPLVIFLDDLQWIDSASLKLLNYLLNDESLRHLMIVGSYRNNEVDQAHPLMINLQRLKKAGIVIDTLMLKPLRLDHVNQLLSDALHCQPTEVQTLTELIVNKTDGNPFFIEEFLKSLYFEKLLSFNAGRGCWEWNVEQIRAQGITDNVVDLMTGKLERLSSDTRRIVSLAACLGNRFDSLTLSAVYQESLEKTITALRQALQMGLIDSVGASSDWLLGSGFSEQDAARIECRFSHDRVQQAAYGLIPDTEKPAVHKSIGELLLASTPQKTFDEKIFEIVTQLSCGMALIVDGSEKKRLVELALRAAKIAKYSGAYDTAFNFLRSAIDVIPGGSWHTDYSLAIRLYAAAVEIASLSGNFAEMDSWLEIGLENATGPLDKIKLYDTKIAVESG